MDGKERRTPEDGGRADVLAELVERERGDDRASFAGGGGHAVCCSAELRGEDFCGVALGCTSVSDCFHFDHGDGNNEGLMRRRERGPSSNGDKTRT